MVGAGRKPEVASAKFRFVEPARNDSNVWASNAHVQLTMRTKNAEMVLKIIRLALLKVEYERGENPQIVVPVNFGTRGGEKCSVKVVRANSDSNVIVKLILPPTSQRETHFIYVAV